ncbi:MAG: hypothetical protein MHMPM18_003550 [Marteilia pararefringens]
MMLLELANYSTLYEKICSCNSNFQSTKRASDPGRSVMIFPETKVLDWFVQILMGLDYLHSRHIVHRDLNPKNILLFRVRLHDSADLTTMLKISDFGISKILDFSSDMLSKTTIGTPKYFSPEVCQGKEYGCKTDIWSLGCILYELATLSHPFDEDSIDKLIRRITKAKYREIPKSMSYTIHKLVKSLLVKNEKDRPSTHSIFKSKLCKNALLSYIEVWRQYDEIQNSLEKNNRRRSINPSSRSKCSAQSFDSRRSATGLIKPKFSTPKSIKSQSVSILQQSAIDRRYSAPLSESNTDWKTSNKNLRQALERTDENTIFEDIENKFTSQMYYQKSPSNPDGKKTLKPSKLRPKSPQALEKEIVTKMNGFVDLLNNVSYIAVPDKYVKLARRKNSLFTALRDSPRDSRDDQCDHKNYKDSRVDTQGEQRKIISLQYLQSLWDKKDLKLLNDWRLLVTYLEALCQSKIQVYNNDQ